MRRGGSQVKANVIMSRMKRGAAIQHKTVSAPPFFYLCGNHGIIFEQEI